MLLAIDTTTMYTGVACCDERGILAESVWYSGRNHTTQVLPHLNLLLHHLGHTPADLHAVAVALGPGSWSGLRVGLSIAKGLAFAGSLALLGVSTLDVLAYQHQQPFVPVYPLINLGRGRFATATFQHTGSEWKRQSDERATTLADLCAEIDDQAFFCGDLDTEAEAQIQRGLQGRASFPDETARVRRPGSLALLGWQRFQAGETDNLATLEPLYLGEPVRKQPDQTTTRTP